MICPVYVADELSGSKSFLKGGDDDEDAFVTGGKAYEI